MLAAGGRHPGARRRRQRPARPPGRRAPPAEQQLYSQAQALADRAAAPAVLSTQLTAVRAHRPVRTPSTVGRARAPTGSFAIRLPAPGVARCLDPRRCSRAAGRSSGPAAGSVYVLIPLQLTATLQKVPSARHARATSMAVLVATRHVQTADRRDRPTSCWSAWSLARGRRRGGLLVGPPLLAAARHRGRGDRTHRRRRPRRPACRSIRATCPSSPPWPRPSTRMGDGLERARHQQRQFLLSVSHDLRTPLTSIRGYADAIADGDHRRRRPGPWRSSLPRPAGSSGWSRTCSTSPGWTPGASRCDPSAGRPGDVMASSQSSASGPRRRPPALELLERPCRTGRPCWVLTDPDRLVQSCPTWSRTPSSSPGTESWSAGAPDGRARSSCGWPTTARASLPRTSPGSSSPTSRSDRRSDPAVGNRAWGWPSWPSWPRPWAAGSGPSPPRGGGGDPCWWSGCPPPARRARSSPAPAQTGAYGRTRPPVDPSDHRQRSPLGREAAAARVDDDRAGDSTPIGERTRGHRPAPRPGHQAADVTVPSSLPLGSGSRLHQRRATHRTEVAGAVVGRVQAARPRRGDGPPGCPGRRAGRPALGRCSTPW